MSNDQIIRSPKRHEVSIPEGSNNASSQKALVGVQEPELSSDAALTIEHEHDSERVRVQEDAVSDHRLTLAQDPESEAHRVLLSPEDAADANRVRLPHEGGRADERVPLPGEDPHASERVKLPMGQAPQDNAVVLPADTREDNVVKLDATTDTDPVEHLAQAGLQDTHARLPDMTTTPDSTVSLDAEHADAPSRAVVDEAHDRAIVAVPEAEPTDDADVAVLEAPNEPPHHTPLAEEAMLEVSHDLPHEPALIHEHPDLAQVSGDLVDKKAEEFRGRVVKLRDEVDQLNRRLDEIEKHEIEKQY